MRIKCGKNALNTTRTEVTIMPKLPNDERVLVTLVDKKGDVVEKRLVRKPLIKIAKELNLKNNLDQGDKIIIESEEL